MSERQIWRCQCPGQCDDGDSCWSDVTQEDFLCDECRANCGKPKWRASIETPQAGSIGYVSAAGSGVGLVQGDQR